MHKITLVSPFPTGEDRSASAGGGIGGQKSKLKAGAAGDKEGKPPLGTANAHRASNAGGTPPIESSTAAGRASAARVQPGDARGEAPCIK